LLAGRITLAAWAYTDTSLAGTSHQRTAAHPITGAMVVQGNVIRSTAGYTPVAGDGAKKPTIYNLRAGADELKVALRTLFAASTWANPPERIVSSQLNATIIWNSGTSATCNGSVNVASSTMKRTFRNGNSYFANPQPTEADVATTSSVVSPATATLLATWRANGISSLVNRLT
jgi:hypothetical protein